MGNEIVPVQKQPQRDKNIYDAICEKFAELQNLHQNLRQVASIVMGHEKVAQNLLDRMTFVEHQRDELLSRIRVLEREVEALKGQR